MPGIEPDKWHDDDPDEMERGHLPLPASLPNTPEVQAAWGNQLPHEQMIYTAALVAVDRRNKWRDGYAAVFPGEEDPAGAGYWFSMRPRIRAIREATKKALMLAKASAPPKLQRMNRATWPSLEVLKPKQRRFVRRYLISYNASRAYREAYDSSVTDAAAGQRGWATLNARSVRLAVEEGARLMMTPGRVIELTAQIAMSDMKDLQPVIDGMGLAEAWAAGCPTNLIRKIKHTKHGIELETYDRLKAVELLGKANGAFGGGVEAMQFGEVRFITSRPLPSPEDIFDVAPVLPSGESDEE